MKKFSPAFVLLVSFLLVLLSCKKINEATELGGDLIPGVDNVTTFELILDAQTTNHIFNDTTRVGYNDNVAAGNLNDPEFGNTHANFQFKIVPTTLRSYPFKDRATLHIDSVVLSLAYTRSYGDTNSIQTLRVYEINSTANFRRDSVYKYSDPSSEFPVIGTQLGAKSFVPTSLNDSINIIRPKDTSRTANVVRIKFDNNTLGERFSLFDTANTSIGGFYSDSIFLTLFNGLAVKADNGSNVLNYFNLTDAAKTRLIVYFHNISGSDTTYGDANFTHSSNGQTNYIQRQHSTNLSNGGGDKLYVQSAPGSYTSITIPGLSNLENKVIHRAEIIATKIPSSLENIFTVPPRLFLERINPNADSAYLFERDLALGADGSIGYDLFGGTLNSGNTYRFNITRYVQGIVTRKERNDVLRLWAPLRSYVFDVNRRDANNPKGTYIQLPVNNRIAEGRVVLAGGGNGNSNSRLRMRIVYSNL